MAVSSSISAAVAHAVSFLTRPLIGHHSAATIGKLQLVLEANLTAHCAASWSSSAPQSGSNLRCLSLTQNCLPPRVIYSACLAAGVQWFDWISLLGMYEFDLFVDPGCVYIRHGRDILNVWTHEIPAPSRTSKSRKTVAQLVLESDADAGIFDMIADEMSAPTWMTPITAQFPAPRRSTSPLSTISSHSRSSSRSSNSSSGFSMSSNDSDSSASSISIASTHSRREKVKTTRVFVDTSKTEVTPYDSGKVGVLTGGVMLGGGPSVKHTKTPSGNWRTVRV